MIDPRLQVLRVLAEVGTLTEVAHRLAYTPSAVSHQLRTLSKDLGVRLVEPRGRGLVLTRAGQLLLDRSQELFTRWEESRGELDELRSEEHTSELQSHGQLVCRLLLEKK